jgi:hypothetical protein
MDELTAHDDRIHECDCHACAIWSRNLLRAAVAAHLGGIEKWLRTGEPETPEVSQAIYEGLCALLNRRPLKPPHFLTVEELADCGLLSELEEGA